MKSIHICLILSRVRKIGILVVAKGGKSCGGSGGLVPRENFLSFCWQNTNREVVCIIYQCKFSQEQPLGCIVRQIYESSFYDVNPWVSTNLEVVCIIYQCKFSQEQPLGCIVRQIYESSFYDVNPLVSIRGNLAEHTSNCKASVPPSATFQRKEVLAVSQRMQCTKQYAFLRSYRSSAVWPFPAIASAC